MKREVRLCLTVVAVLAMPAALAVGCGRQPAPGPEVLEPEVQAAEAAAEVDWTTLVPRGRVPFEGILTAGQPSPEQFRALRDAGFATVINLRRPGERGTAGEPEQVAALGMEYVSIPVAGAEGLTEDNARALAAALAEVEGPVVVHCGSSNRVGALFALKAFYLEGATPEQALEVGRSAGLTRLEPDVRQIVGADPGP